MLISCFLFVLFALPLYFTHSFSRRILAAAILFAVIAETNEVIRNIYFKKSF